MMKTLLKWISEDNWDYTKGVPKIGFYGWTEPSTVSQEEALKEYCQAHPDEFDLFDVFRVPLGQMTISSSILIDLKDCDYICAPGMAAVEFIKQYRARGYKATLIDGGILSGYRGPLADSVGWEGIDGSLTPIPALHWSDTTFNMVKEARELLHRYLPGKEEEIVYAGNTYIGCWQQFVTVFDILKDAIAQVGAENFNGQAFYDAAVKYKTTGSVWEGFPQWGFSETKRMLVDHCGVYKFSAQAEDMIRVSDWLPLVSE
jgi:hypothetical protein